MKKIILIIIMAISVNSYCQVPRLFGNEDLKPCKEGDLYGFRNSKGEIVISCEYDYVGDFIEGLACVKKNGKNGYIDETGKIVIPLDFDFAHNFSEGLAVVGNYVNGEIKSGHINKHGQIVTPLDYKSVGNFHEGVAYVFNGSKYGFVNKYGKEITPCKYSSYIKGEGGYKYKYAPNFSEGLAVVKKGSRWVYINHQGETIVKLNKQQQPIWNGSDGAFNCFSDGVVWVIGDNLTFCILDKKGNELSSLPTYLSNIKLSIRYPIQRFIGGYSEISSREKGLKLLVNKHAEIVAVYDSKYNLIENYKELETQLILAKWLYENYYSSYDMNGPCYYESYIIRSYELFKKIAEQGNSYAQYVAGFMAQYGQGTESNEWEARKWYKQSKEPNAKKQLAMLDGKEYIQEPQQKAISNLLVSSNIKNEGKESFIISQEMPTKEVITTNEKSREEIIAQNESLLFEQGELQTIVEKKKEKRLALVIGNGDYNENFGLNPLKSPINDARDMLIKLKSLGFDIIPNSTNLTYDKMREVIKFFCEKAKGYDVVLFYYSGHAVQYEKHSMLIPIGQRFEMDSDFRNYTINLEDVLSEIKGNNEKQVRIFVIDACRQTYNDGYKGKKDEIEDFEIEQGRKRKHGFYAYATRLYEKAEDGSRRNMKHSPFTEVLLKLIDNKYETLDDLFTDVKIKVSDVTNKRQIPLHFNDLPVEFVKFKF